MLKNSQPVVVAQLCDHRAINIYCTDHVCLCHNNLLYCPGDAFDLGQRWAANVPQ